MEALGNIQGSKQCEAYDTGPYSMVSDYSKRSFCEFLPSRGTVSYANFHIEDGHRILYGDVVMAPTKVLM